MARLERSADRPAAVAGLFYPDDPDTLRRVVREYLERAEAQADPTDVSPRAILVPHAGYVFSGPTAAVAFAAVRERPRRVVMLGPAHRVPVSGVSAGDFSRYTCPLGALPVDHEAIAALEGLGLVDFVPEAHAREHCLEVMIPFLLERFGEVPIVPLLVGRATPEDVERILDAVLRDGDLLVISSDLSHYEPDEVARRKDTRTLRAVEHGDWDTLGPYEACGFLGLSGALRYGRRHGWRSVLLDYSNSGDASGDRSKVVGYGAAAFIEAT
ncbi:MAG: AmmeMemoRadiSam system protein B [Myxococcota bacterium]